MLTFAGDVTIKGFTRADSTLTLVGTAARTADLGGQTYRRVVVGTTGSPSLAFSDAFATDFLTCSGDAAFALSFAAGKTTTIGEMSLNGVVGGAAALTVGSTSAGTAALLDVTGKASGTGLIVRDSHVTGAVQAFAYNPSTSGDNVAGWVFGITETAWQGGASGNWSDAANWSGGAVPDADSCVHFTSGATVTLDVDDATAKILDIAGGTVNLKGAKTLTVTTLFEILDGGTLCQASSGSVVRVGGAAYVRSGGTWTHAENGTADAVKGNDNGYRVLAEVTGNMTVEEGGSVTAYGCGYCGGRGPGTQSSASYGGRVAVYQTTATDFTAFTGKATTYGGVTTGVAGAAPERPAGTVYLQSAGEVDGGGVVYVRDGRGDVEGNSATGGADLPVGNLCPDSARGCRRATFSVSAGGILYLTRDVTIYELELASSGRVNLNGHTLTLVSHRHKDRKGWPTSWAGYCGISYGTDAAGNAGKIVWKPRPLCVILR